MMFFWNYEDDCWILKGEIWENLRTKVFDAPAAFYGLPPHAALELRNRHRQPVTGTVPRGDQDRRLPVRADAFGSATLRRALLILELTGCHKRRNFFDVSWGSKPSRYLRSLLTSSTGLARPPRVTPVLGIWRQDFLVFEHAPVIEVAQPSPKGLRRAA